MRRIAYSAAGERRKDDERAVLVRRLALAADTMPQMIEAPTVPALLREAAHRFGDRTALFAQTNEAISYRELDRQTDKIARALIADGALSGERLAIWAPNMWEWVALAVGVQRAGGAVVPLNTRLNGGEVADIVRRSDARRLAVIGTFLERDYPTMLNGEDMPELRSIIVLRDQSEGGGFSESWDRFLSRGVATGEAQVAGRQAAWRRRVTF